MRFLTRFFLGRILNFVSRAESSAAQDLLAGSEKIKLVKQIQEGLGPSLIYLMLKKKEASIILMALASNRERDELAN